MGSTKLPGKVVIYRHWKKVENKKEIGIYYGTGVPTKQWTPIIDPLIDTYRVTLTDYLEDCPN
jgi:hypothetical protein